MKKFTKLIFIFSIFLFTSCEILDALLDFESEENSNEKTQTAQYKTTTVQTNPEGMIYYVKLNNSEEIVTAKETGYARFAELPEEKNDTDSFIRNLNSQLNECVKNSVENASSRAADDSTTVTSGYKKLTYSEGDTTNFYSYTKTETTILGQEKNISEEVNSICKYAGKHCYVFADKKNSSMTSKGINLSDDDYKKLGQKFDSCYELETSIIGNPLYSEYNSNYYVQCNDKIIILVSDLFGDASDSQDSGTVGYFYQGDMYKQTYLDKNKGFFSADINSNECEMFYIDALFLSKLPDTVYSTLVHEFNHMINYVIKTVNYMTANPSARSFRTCDVWFTEMLSMTTEDMFQSYLGIKDEDSPKGRLPYFNLYYNYGFKLWNNSSVPDLIMYANTYAFGAFLVRNFGGVQLLKEIAQNEYIDETAITKALQKCNPNYTFIDDITQQSKKIDYEHALRKFSMCLFNIQRPSNSDLSTNGDNQYFSFYRATDEDRSDGLKFTAIDIMNIECNVENDKGEVEKQKISPKIYNKGEQVSLGPSGFSVHYVGKNINSFEITMNTKLEYYLITMK